MKTIYLIRHGESEFNHQKRFAGWTDCGLTDLGINQAVEAGLRMENLDKVDAVYCSDLIRAKKTGQIIAEKLGVKAYATEALRESFIGAWEGLTVEEIEDRDPELLKKWFVNFGDFQYPGGESTEDVLNRATQFIESVLEDQNTIVIVAHAGIISILLSHWLVGDTARTGIFRVKNARIQRLVYTAGFWSLDLLNG